MGKQVYVRAHSDIPLPNTDLYTVGKTVILSEEDFSSLPAEYVAACLTVQGTVADPSPLPSGAGSRPGWTSALVAALRDGVESVAIHIIGDSTGYTSGKTRWPYLVAPWLAAEYPTYGVQTLTWDDSATQAYSAAVQVQAPPKGARYLDGTSANISSIHPGYGIKVAANASIDIRAKVSLNSWSNNVLSNLLSRRVLSSGVQCFSFAYKPGALTFSMTSDGTSGNSFQIQSNGSFPIALTDGQPTWFRVVVNPNATANTTASFTFYQSSDGVTWQTIGTQVTHAYTAGSIYEGTNGQWDHEIIASANTVNVLLGKIYSISLIDSSTGLNLLPSTVDAFLPGSGTTPATLGGSPMITIVNGSASGRDLTYLSDTTRLPKMLPFDYNPAAVIVSCSHNDGTQRGAAYLAKWDTWLSIVRGRMPMVPIAVTLQNPKTSPAINRIHSGRVRDIGVWAYRNNLSIIDVYRAFVESPTALVSLVDTTDGIHPSDAYGSPLWAQVVEGHLSARV